MKKLLLSTAAAGLVMAATPAHAEIDLEMGGFFKGYMAYVSQDDNVVAATPETNGEARDFDMVRHTELHFTGETTLDNGLTVGYHAELEADGNRNAADGLFEESYAYFSSGWGRVNVGAEDGAQYLLQVAAPSADSNIDGIRQYVQPINYTTADGAGAGTANVLNAAVIVSGIDYETNATGYADKLTYLSPVMNGFQVGVSYTPDTVDAATDVTGVAFDDVDNAFGSAYEGSVRYEGTFNNVGVTLGAGYTHIELESRRADATTVTQDFTDDRTVWNVGADFDIGPFGVGISYSEDDYGEQENTATTTATRGEEETLVIGVDYTTGPFKLGASYLEQDGTLNVLGNTGTDGVETERWTGGVVYTYGPGMTFRGSISHIEHDNLSGPTAAQGDSADATSILVGTQINF